MHGHDLMDDRAISSKNVVQKKNQGTAVTPKNRKVTSRRNISNKNRKRAGGGHIKQGVRKDGVIRKSTLSPGKKMSSNSADVKKDTKVDTNSSAKLSTPSHDSKTNGKVTPLFKSTLLANSKFITS